MNNKLTFKDLKKTLKLRRDTRLEMAQYKAAKLQETKLQEYLIQIP